MATREIPRLVPLVSLPVQSQVAATANWSTEPSWRELWLVVCCSFALFFAVIVSFASFSKLVENFGDSSAYMDIATAVYKWNFQGVVVKQFWGLPYLMALLMWVFHMNKMAALISCSLLSSFMAVDLSRRLWGSWVALLFALTNFDWLQRSILGGAEPLFMALLLAGFLAVRRQRWLWGALLLSLATVVRPLGVLALMALAIAFFKNKQFTRLLCSIAIGAAVGLCYSIPFLLYFHSPFANLQAYQQRDWTGGSLLVFPFSRIARELFSTHQPWTNTLLIGTWVLLVLTATFVGIRTKLSGELDQYPAEAIFALLYVLFLFTYNSPWAWADFTRFAIPILPFVWVCLRNYLPKDKRLVWAASLTTAILAACSAIGVRNVAEILRHAF